MNAKHTIHAQLNVVLRLNVSEAYALQPITITGVYKNILNATHYRWHVPKWSENPSVKLISWMFAAIPGIVLILKIFSFSLLNCGFLNFSKL